MPDESMSIERARAIALGAKAILEVAELKLDRAGYRNAARQLYELRLRFDDVMRELPVADAMPSGSDPHGR